MAVLKYKSGSGVKTLGIVEGGSSGVTSVNGKTGAVTGVYDADNAPPYPVTSVNGKTGAVTGIYGVNNPPPYPVTKVDGKTGAVDTFSFMEASSFPKSITKSGGITGVSLPVQVSYSLPKGNTYVFQINFGGGNPIPVSASFIGNGYGVQCSVCKNSNTSFMVSITNNGLDSISLSGVRICVTFYPNGATSITEVTDA